jgi:hypothetical protein
MSILLLISMMFIAFIRLNTGMPLAGNCSAVIAAACHSRAAEDREDISASEVQWGVTGYDEDNIGYCAFSVSEGLEQPINDNLYM